MFAYFVPLGSCNETNRGIDLIKINFYWIIRHYAASPSFLTRMVQKTSKQQQRYEVALYDSLTNNPSAAIPTVDLFSMVSIKISGWLQTCAHIAILKSEESNKQNKEHMNGKGQTGGKQNALKTKMS